VPLHGIRGGDIDVQDNQPDQYGKWEKDQNNYNDTCGGDAEHRQENKETLAPLPSRL